MICNLCVSEWYRLFCCIFRGSCHRQIIKGIFPKQKLFRIGKRPVSVSVEEVFAWYCCRGHTRTQNFVVENDLGYKALASEHFSRQQATCCLVLSWQQINWNCCRESTRKQFACCRESSRQQNFVSEYVLSHNNLQPLFEILPGSWPQNFAAEKMLGHKILLPRTSSATSNLFPSTFSATIWIYLLPRKF